MIAQLIGFVVCSFCFTVIGSLVKKLASWTIPCVYDFLIGLSLSNAVFTLFSLGYPINNTAAFLFVAFVLVLCLLNIHYERIYFRQLLDTFAHYTRENTALSCLLFLFTVLTFFQSLYTPSLHYDAGLYHIPSIKWLAEHKTIIGLVHLNSFLGYNFNIFSLDAAFYHVFQQPIYPINFTIIVLFSLWLFPRMSASIQSAQYLTAAAYLLLFYYLMRSYWPHVSTPSTDTLVFILILLILVPAAELKTKPALAFPIVILATYATTVKLSAIPVLLLALYVLLTKPYWLPKKQALIALLISGFILVPWLIRNVLLTGWLVFPVPAINLFSFDWKLSLQEVISRKEAIRYYYVNQEQAWLMRQSGTDLLVIITCLCALSSLIFRVITKRIYLSAVWLVVVGVSVVGIVFTLLYSPSLRYGSAFFLTVTLLSSQSLTYKSVGSQYVFYVLGAFITGSFLIENWFHPWHFTKDIAHRFLLPYPLVKTQKKEFAYFLIDKKIKCYYPVQSDQCFDQTLPCANRKVEHIHLRGTEIDQGFYSVTP